jgi:hypothetical protein
MTVLTKELDILAERRKGRSYASIAAAFGLAGATVGRYCRRAGLGTGRIRPRASDAEYGKAWIARVKARCTIVENGCWLWNGFLNHKGYGQTGWRGKNAFAHRRMYMVVHGISKLKTEQTVCHSCDVRNCCNPDHLWLGDAAANVLDSAIKKRHRNARKTHCIRGHELTGKNLFVCSAGLRHCNTCSRIRQRIRSGWTRAEAEADITPIAQNAKTPRRWTGKRKAA